MADLRPFNGLRPPPVHAPEVAAPPYDVVDTREARALADGKPRSFFHVSRPEIDLPEGTDEHAEAVYEKGAENLKRFVAQGWLIRDPTPRFYVYRQKMGEHVQTGLVASASVAEYDEGVIKKHEHTRQDKEDDRTLHIGLLDAHDEPVFLTYRSTPSVDGLLEEAAKDTPTCDFTSEDGVGHTFWVVDEALGARIQEAFKGVTALYVADGHHRSAAASRVAKQRRDKGQTEGFHQRFLTVTFPHTQMKVLDYNRVVKDLNGLDEAQLLEKIREKFEVAEASSARPEALHQFGMYLGVGEAGAGRWYRLTAKPGTFEQTPTGVLDVDILQRNLLGPILGIGEPRTDPRISFVGGIRGLKTLEERVDSGANAVAFSMFPTALEQLMEVADAGEVMPPKSTWFEPKLRSGLVVHPFE